jgi:hypothetical protein
MYVFKNSRTNPHLYSVMVSVPTDRSGLSPISDQITRSLVEWFAFRPAYRRYSSGCAKPPSPNCVMISNSTSRSEPVAHFGSNHPLSGRMFAFQPADRSYKIFHLRSNRQIGAKEHFRTNHPICSVMVGVVKQPTDRNYSQCRVKSTLL